MRVTFSDPMAIEGSTGCGELDGKNVTFCPNYDYNNNEVSYFHVALRRPDNSLAWGQMEKFVTTKDHCGLGDKGGETGCSTSQWP